MFSLTKPRLLLVEQIRQLCIGQALAGQQLALGSDSLVLYFDTHCVCILCLWWGVATKQCEGS